MAGVIVLSVIDSLFLLAHRPLPGLPPPPLFIAIYHHLLLLVFEIPYSVVYSSNQIGILAYRL